MAHRSTKILAGIFCGLLAAAEACAAPAERPRRLEVWDLALGTPADQLPDEFIDLACGTNGGPPALPLNAFTEFRRCRAEPSGLREVYFRYDDELEYWAKANDLQAQMEQYSGTKTYGFPIVVSGLFDADGVLRGIRIVSATRATRRRTGTRRISCATSSTRASVAITGSAMICRSRTARRRSAAFSSSRPVGKRSTRARRRSWPRATCASPARRSSTRSRAVETTGQFESSVRFELIRAK